jgi:hypothetical protein
MTPLHREPMNGTQFVHDQLEVAGCEVQIADAQKVEGLARLAFSARPYRTPCGLRVWRHRTRCRCP